MSSVRRHNDKVVQDAIDWLRRDNGAQLGLPRAQLEGDVSVRLDRLKPIPGEDPPDTDRLIQYVIAQAERTFP